jgi:C_GCAxxG_C_C family probable redox protein
MAGDESKAGLRQSAEALWAEGFFCAESVLLAVTRDQGIESDLLPAVASAFCSGQARTCGQCGALNGALMALGAVLGRRTHQDSTDRVYAAAKRLVREFEGEFGSRSCQDLLDGCDLGTPQGQAMFRERGFQGRCREFTVRAAEMAGRILAELRR